MDETAIPVTLLTGFLGSGKSTLLTRILRDPRYARTAVVVNEFGEIGLDGFLVEHSSEQIVEMTSGCLCCTIRGDIRETLLDLHRRREMGDIPAFDRLVVETTGLADPAPVIHTLMADRQMAGRFALSGVITTVDAVTAEFTLERHAECVKQVAVADRIVLTKTDLVTDPVSRSDLGKLRQALARLNPGAPILDGNERQFDHESLFDTALFSPSDKSVDVLEWLNAEAYADNHHDHHHHSHDVNRHGADIQAFSLVLDEPVSAPAFIIALELLFANQGEDLLRVKGIVNLAEKPDKPVVIHGVQHILHEPLWLDRWPTEDRRTRLVFITRNIPEETIRSFFTAWQKFGRDRPRELAV